MAAVQPGSARRLGRVALPDPVYPIWRWLTTVRNAIQLIALLTLFALAGVIIPQVPPQLLDSPAAVAQHVDNQRPTFDHVPAATILLPFAAFLVWLAFRRLAPQRRRDSAPSRPPLGPVLVGAGLLLGLTIDALGGVGGLALTDPLADFPWVYDTNGGVFNLFNQPYLFVLIGVLAVAITTCTISRFPPIWRSVRWPQRRVNDRYFERARQRLDFANPAPPDTTAESIAAALRRRHFSVKLEQRDGAHYLFAQKHQWAQLATFASHLALILLVIGTLLTKFAGEELQFWVGEGQSRPLFETGGDRQQVQIIVDDAIARFNDEGQALDFRSLVRVTTAGEQVAAGEVTVNGPLHAAGFRVHQAAYWEHGAALQVRDAASGQLLYSETLMLQEQFFGPRIVTADASSGAIFADEVVQLRFPLADIEGAAYELIPLAQDVSLALVLVPDEADGVQFHYALVPIAAQSVAGETLASADLRIGQPAPPAPRIRLTNADGELLLETVVPLQATNLASDLGERLGLLPLPDGRLLTVGYAGDAGSFFYFDETDAARRGLLAQGESVALGAATLQYVREDIDRSSHGALQPGDSQVVGRVQLTYGGAESVFFALVDDLPGSTGQSVVAIERFGQALTSSEFNAFGGENVDLDRSVVSGRYADRPARLGIGLGDVPRFDLDEGQSRISGDYEYAFLGPREFTGLNLRRDPGGTIFWIAIILGTLGLLTTFFVPRRRIWARVTADRTYLAGLATHGVDMRRWEFHGLAQELDAPGVAPLEPEQGEDWDR
ncbi:MAG: Cytochrome c biogenesis protein ResB/Cytochrome c biogenesis protein ResB [Chloroflexi bacterium]|nr:MAG: Cytochrome c biogenesis protein ResB/Cytochrome c biogenesis protein ResB [Chloroflexota bacterium]